MAALPQQSAALSGAFDAFLFFFPALYGFTLCCKLLLAVCLMGHLLHPLLICLRVFAIIRAVISFITILLLRFVGKVVVLRSPSPAAILALGALPNPVGINPGRHALVMALLAIDPLLSRLLPLVGAVALPLCRFLQQQVRNDNAIGGYS